MILEKCLWTLTPWFPLFLGLLCHWDGDRSEEHNSLLWLLTAGGLPLLFLLLELTCLLPHWQCSAELGCLLEETTVLLLSAYFICSVSPRFWPMLKLCKCRMLPTHRRLPGYLADEAGIGTGMDKTCPREPQRGIYSVTALRVQGRLEWRQEGLVVASAAGWSGILH